VPASRKVQDSSTHLSLCFLNLFIFPGWSRAPPGRENVHGQRWIAKNCNTKEHDLISSLLYCVLIIEAHYNILQSNLAYLSLANFRRCPLDISQPQSTCSPNCTWSGSQGRAGERWISRRSFALWAPRALWHGRRIHHQRVRLLQ